MTNLLAAAIIDAPDDHAFAKGLLGYPAAVATGLGVGLESCAVDPLSPALAYITLDDPVPGFPERDLALLRDDRFGWSAAMETPTSDDPTVLAHHSGGLLPRPSQLYAFVAAVRAGNHSTGRTAPPDPIVPMARSEFTLLLRAYELPNADPCPE